MMACHVMASVILPAGGIFLRDSAVIAQALLERRIPSIAAFHENMEAGALISYGFDLMGLFYDIASYVHRLAGGAKPSDMPIEQSPRFYMAINLKTAASLGVSLSDVKTRLPDPRSTSGCLLL